MFTLLPRVFRPAASSSTFPRLALMSSSTLTDGIVGVVSGQPVDQIQRKVSALSLSLSSNISHTHMLCVYRFASINLLAQPCNKAFLVSKRGVWNG